MAIDADTPRIFREVLERLERTRRKENAVELIHGILIATFVVVSLAGLAIVVEALFRVGIVGRSLLFWSVVLATLSTLGWFVIRPLLKLIRLFPGTDDFTLAQKVGDAFPEVHDRLLNVLQLYGERDDPRLHYSVDLIDASFAELYEKVQSLEFESIITYDRAKKLAQRAALSAAVILVVFFVSPSSFLTSADRLFNFHQTFAAPAPFQLIVKPGNTEIVKGEAVTVRVSVDGDRPPSVYLFKKQENQQDFEKLKLEEFGDEFRYEIRNVKSSTRYYASSGEVISDTYIIRVIDRPHVRHLHVRIISPPYAGLPVKHLEDNVGGVTALRGSRVHVQVSTSKRVGRAVLVFNDRRDLPMIAEGDGAAAEFVLREDGTYRVVLVDAEGLQNVDPIEYQLKVVPDEYPTISVPIPGRDVDVTEKLKLNLLVKIRDDFGFSQLHIAYRLSHSRYEPPWPENRYESILLPEGRITNAEIPHLWNFEALRLVPEDVVSYYVEVYDNDRVSGPKAARSETYVVRLPSLDEVFADLERAHEGTAETIEDLLEEAGDLRKDLEDLNREMRADQSKMDWQQQKKAEELQKRYEELTQKIDDMSRTMSQVMEKMQKNLLLSPETLEKYMELQQLFEQMNSPELAEAFKRLQQAVEQLSPESMKQALRQLRFSEEAFRQSLERTINLFKRIQIELKVDEILKRVESLLQQQEALRQELMNADSTDRETLERLSRKQEDLQRQLDRLENELSDLKHKMMEFPEEMPLGELEQLMQQLDAQKIDEQMLKASRQMKAGRTQRAMGHQQEAEKGLTQLFLQMQNIQDMLQQNQQRQVLNALRKALQDLLELSKRQEFLKNEVRSLDPNSQRFRENAQGQMNVTNDLMNVVNSLIALSQKTFAVTPEMGKVIGQALRQMHDALNALEGRNRGLAHQQQTQAMGSLNQSAMFILNAMQALMQGGGSGGLQMFLQRLGRITMQQMGLNRMTMEQQAEMARLAAMQEMIRKSLEQLAQEAQASGQSSRILGDLDQIVEEMRNVQKDLEGGTVTSETLRKQERILSRLLNSQRSIRERDYEQRRKAVTATDFTRKSPTELDLSTLEGQNRLRIDMLKAMEEGYSKDYEELIRTYYEALQKLEIQHP
ncbi:MAG: DUF4175 family protein [Bacteroidota bacterium]